MDGQKGQGERQWWQTHRKGEPLAICILYYIHIHIAQRISQFYCFSTVVSIPFCSLIPVRNIPQKVLFTQATYTRKHFIPPLLWPSTLHTLMYIYYPFSITFIAHFECASQGTNSDANVIPIGF
jgi:hypothetical protein